MAHPKGHRVVPTLGAEEELFLVDRETGHLANGASQLIGAVPTGRLKAELFECIVETTTPIATHPREILEALTHARRSVGRACVKQALLPLAVGVHPWPLFERPRITATRYYRGVAARLGEALWGQLVCGLHVHIGFTSMRRTLNSLEGMVPWLPCVLAVAVNSPFDDGEESALLSVRAARLAAIQDSPLPPVHDSTRKQGSSKQVEPGWWDIRLNRRYGTLEVRIPDQPTDVRRSAAIVALAHALAVTADRQTNSLADRAAYVEARQEALAGGWSPAAIARHVEPVATELGTWDVLVDLFESVREAETQLQFAREQGVEALVHDLLDRTIP